jgi:uncharacterized membrane protein YjjP (DUF1212 family)
MLGMLGSILLLVGVIWMVVVAVQTGQTTGEKALWGLVCFFCSPLGSIIFYIVKRQGMIPLLLQIVGFVIMLLGGGFNYSYGGMPPTTTP